MTQRQHLCEVTQTAAPLSCERGLGLGSPAVKASPGPPRPDMAGSLPAASGKSLGFDSDPSVLKLGA